MPEFACRVATSAGEIFEKIFVASDESALRRELETQDLMILDMRRRNAFLRHLLRILKIKGSVSSKDFLFFNQELRALLKAGLPIVPSLNILLERRKNKTFRNSLIDVRDRVKSGAALSEAFAAQSELYPSLYAASLASGERSGELVGVLERFVAFQQKILGVRRKVVSALIYPAVLVILSIFLLLLMIFFIIPKFNEFLIDFGTELPLLTRVMVGTSMVAKDHWMLIVGGSLATVGFFMWWTRTESGRVSFDGIKLRVPVIGTVMNSYAQNRFTRTLGTLQSGGIPLVSSLELAAGGVGNAVYEQALMGVADRVREGESLWESLDRTGLFSDIAVQMIKVGESTGAMDEMLTSTSDFTDEEIDAQLTRMMSLIEPLMLIFMAFVVGIMLLSVYYPLLQAYGQSTA
jgi:type IV pilus assembly protein PilC